MVVGSGAGGVVAAELAAQEQPCRSSSTRSSRRAPRPPRCRGCPTRAGCSRSRTAPTRSPCSARWSARATTKRTTVVFDAAGSSSEGVYVAGARAADSSPDVVAELDRLRELGYLAPA